MYNQIFEPVEVIGYFHKSEFRVVRFKWYESIYNVSKLNATWRVPAGNNYTYHYSVICEKQNVICELSFNLNDLKWELVQISQIN
jgi:hypothetical protein